MNDTVRTNIDVIDELIGLNDWKTKGQISKELSLAMPGLTLNERTFRKNVEDHNKLFTEHLKDTFVAHSKKGYKLTTDYKEIKESIEDNKVRAMDQLVKYYKGKKALGENLNCKLHVENGNLVYVEEEVKE